MGHVDGKVKKTNGSRASFNLGFGGLNPEIERGLAQRVRRAHQAAGRRIKLAVIEFNPFQATSVRASRDALVRDQHLMMLATPTQIAALALQSPQRAARYFSGHFFRKSLSAETVTGSFGFIAAGVGEVFGPVAPDAAKPSAEMQAVLDRIPAGGTDHRWHRGYRSRRHPGSGDAVARQGHRRLW